MNFKKIIHDAGFHLQYQSGSFFVYISDNAGLALEYDSESKAISVSQIVAEVLFFDSICSPMEAEI